MITWTDTKLTLAITKAHWPLASGAKNEMVSLTVQAINSLSHDKIQDWSKLKEPADNNINVTEKSKFVLQRVENIVRKGENAHIEQFLLFPQCFLPI